MPTLIALPKKDRAPAVEGAAAIRPRQALLAEETWRPRRADEELLELGLPPIRPEEPAPDEPPAAEPGYRRLGHVGAYVVAVPGKRQVEQVCEALERQYHVLPNIELELPAPTLAGNIIRRGRRSATWPAGSRPAWPAESGVAEARREGLTGRGVLVGVLDTGCDADHLELARKRIDFRYVPLHPTAVRPRAVRGFDVHGHGTHVCGIIAGREVGVAPEVELLVASVIESETLKTSLERIMVALDWMLAQFQRQENLEKPLILNLSLGFRPQDIAASQLQAVVDGLRDLLSLLATDFDVLPVVAIGNDTAGRMRAPGYFPEALSVGAVDFRHQPAPFSGGGNSPVTGQPVPNVAGYGVDVLSSLERDPRDGSLYARMSGTSMAAPYVTGIAALFASAEPQLRGNALRERVLRAALPLGAAPERVGAGLARYTAGGDVHE